MVKSLLIAAMLVLGSTISGSAQLQVCYVANQQGYYDSATDSCVISSPWPDQPAPAGPPNGVIVQGCYLSQDGCTYICNVWYPPTQSYEPTAIQDYCQP